MNDSETDTIDCEENICFFNDTADCVVFSKYEVANALACTTCDNNIWIGHSNVLNDIEFVQNENIRTIFCIGPDDKKVDCIEGVNYIDITLEEKYNRENQEGFEKYIDMLADLVHTKAKEGNVLLHCPTGNQLSPSILAGYLIKFHKMSVREALNYIRENAHCTFRGELFFLECLFRYFRKLSKLQGNKK
jgi:hypothetical protein